MLPLSGYVWRIIGKDCLSGVLGLTEKRHFFVRGNVVGRGRYVEEAERRLQTTSRYEEKDS
jgi:hypothetical protein